MRSNSIGTKNRAIAVGLVTLAAALGGCGHDTTTQPPPPPPIASITVSPSSDSLAAGQTVQLTAVAKNGDGAVITAAFTWTSANQAVATVDSTGLVTAVAAGTTTIAATSGIASGKATMTVGGGTTSSSNFSHVFLLVLENRDLSGVIGSSSWPYLNSLATQYAYANNYSAATHPSIGNYFMMTTGDTLTNNDINATVWNVDNVVRRLNAAGKTWTSYAEDLPNVGYVGPDDGTYTRHHNPFTLLSDVANSASQRQHLQPYSQLAADLGAGHLTDYVFIAPNSCDDGHDCADGTVDNWLKNNVPAIINSAVFNQSSILIITFDENESYTGAGGGQVPWLVVGPKVKHGYTSNAAYGHSSTLRLTLEGLGVNSWPGQAASAPSMMEFFTP
ncbi:MAG TPA: alkaline phosphatase family protein [Gemmatimonadales bacterium]